MNPQERDELARLLVPTDAPAAQRHILTWEQIPSVGDLKRQPVEWLVDGMVPRGGLVLVAGDSGCGKTWLALDLARAVSTGGVFLGRNCRRTDVLYLDFENLESLIYERTQILGMTDGPHLKLWGSWAADRAPRMGDERLRKLASERPLLIIIDALIRFHDQEENSASSMCLVMNELRCLANTPATVVALHHKPKGETALYRGSSDIHAAVDVAFSLTPVRDSGLLKIQCFKNRMAPDFSLTVRPEFQPGNAFVVVSAPETQHDRDAADANRLFDLITAKPGVSQSELLRESGMGQKRTISLLAKFEGRLWRVERGGRKKLLYAPLPADRQNGNP